MISFTIETQRPVYWTTVTWCLVLLAALCCCNCLPHQKTVNITDPLQSDSVNNASTTTDCTPTTSAAPTAAARPHSDHGRPPAPLPTAGRHTSQPEAAFVSHLHATAAADNIATSTASPTATPATADSTSSSTAATPATPTGCNYTQPPDAAAVSFFRNLSAKEKGRRLGNAAYDGSVQEVRALLAAGADVGARGGDGWTALHWAAEGGSVEAVQCLLQAGAKVDARGSEWQHTPLHRAAGRGHTVVVRLLLEATADPNARSVSGKTPLHRAAMDGRAEAVAALLEAGADRWITNNWGETALDVARIFKRKRVIQMLE